jgi:Kdo2-lipid IVA lauroyltransferase/acyltransferase
MQTPPPFKSFTGIKFWPTWLGLGLLWIIVWMPFTVRMKTGEMLGLLTYWLGKERRYITEINIALCFPELNEQEKSNLVKNCFLENGIGLIETATCWIRKKEQFKKQVTLIGLDKLEEAQARGKGILLIGGHYSTLDFGGYLLSLFHPFAATYRPHGNPLFNAFMLRGRLSNCTGIFDRNDIRGAFRHLKQGKTLWYAPDQDYGPKHAVYSSFFGKQAATITAGSRFAEINQSPTFLIRHHRINRTRQYEIEFIPFPDSFPCKDELKDTTVINQMLEKAIRQYPAQYLWMHKRFKTQPGGKPNSPYINIKTPNHRLTESQYEQVIANATQVSELEQVHDYKLPSGLWLKQYPGMISKRFFQKHPAKIFDRHAKELRMQGIQAITVDNFFRIPRLKVSAVTYFVPEGPLLSQLPQNEIPLQALATFMAELHNKGFDCTNPGPDHFIVRDNTFAIHDPTDFVFHRSSISLKDRRSTVIKLLQNLNLGKTEGDLFFSHYAQAAGLSVNGTD